MNIRSDDRAVSNVVGVILVVAIAIIAIAIISTSVIGVVNDSTNSGNGLAGVSVTETDEISNSKTENTLERDRMYRVSVTESFNLEYVYVEQDGAVQKVAFDDCNSDNAIDEDGDGSVKNDASRAGDTICFWLSNSASTDVIAVSEKGEETLVQTVTNEKDPVEVEIDVVSSPNRLGYTYQLVVKDMGEFDKTYWDVRDVRPENVEILQNDGYISNDNPSNNDRIVLDEEGEEVVVDGIGEPHYVYSYGEYGSLNVDITNNGGYADHVVLNDFDTDNVEYDIKINDSTDNMTGLVVYDYSTGEFKGVKTGETVSTQVSVAKSVLPSSISDPNGETQIYGLWYDANGNGEYDANADDGDSSTSNDEMVSTYKPNGKTGKYKPYHLESGVYGAGYSYTINGSVYFHGSEYVGEIQIEIVDAEVVSE